MAKVVVLDSIIVREQFEVLAELWMLIISVKILIYPCLH